MDEIVWAACWPGIDGKSLRKLFTTRQQAEMCAEEMEYRHSLYLGEVLVEQGIVQEWRGVQR